MSSEEKMPVNWKWGLLWMGVNALSFAVGIALSQVLLGTVGEVVGFAIFGAVIGLAQWLLLRKLLPGSAWWILLSASALALGMVEVNTIGAVMYWSFTSRLIGFGMLGLTAGILQTFLLRRYFKGVDFWLLVSALGWALGSVIGLIPLPIADFWLVLVDYLLLGLGYGFISAIFFVIQFRKIKMPEINMDVPWVRIAGAIIALLVFIALPAWRLTKIPQLDQLGLPVLGAEPECELLPPMICDDSQGDCAEIEFFEPVEGEGYLNYPVNGETFADQYRSYLRQDLMMIVKYATAKVACKTAGWTYVDYRPVWLIDMSEADGSIPGTSVGKPGHPPGTHVIGKDLDIAYFHTDVPLVWPWEEDDPELIKGNHPMDVCQPMIFGMDVYHCAKEPTLLDPWRTALLIAYISEHPDIRVIGVDGKVGPVIESALDQLVEAGWLTDAERASIPLAYEEENTGLGWYFHHFHHMHVSLDVEY